MAPRFILLAAALLLCGCDKLDQRGMVMTLDPAYRAEIVLGTADGISSPDGLLWADGRLYIADEGGSAVRVWTPGEGVRTLADARAGLVSPEDIARDGAGNLYVTDDSSGGVLRIGRGGIVRLAGAEEGLPSTEGLALGPGGIVLAGDQPGRRIVSIAADGSVAAFLAGIAKPESLAFDGRGNLYIADNEANVLYVMTPGRRLHRPIQARGGFSPESLHFDGGALFITDSDHGKLYRYTPQDGLVTIAVFGGELANVQGIAGDERGNLYLSIQSDLAGRRGYVLRLARTR